MIYVLLCLVVFFTLASFIFVQALRAKDERRFWREFELLRILWIAILVIPLFSPMYWEFPSVFKTKQVFVVKDGKAVKSAWYGTTHLGQRIIACYGPVTISDSFMMTSPEGYVYKIHTKYKLEVTDPLLCADATRDWLVGYAPSGDSSFRTMHPDWVTDFPRHCFETNIGVFVSLDIEKIRGVVEKEGQKVCPLGMRFSLVGVEKGSF